MLRLKSLAGILLFALSPLSLADYVPLSPLPFQFQDPVNSVNMSGGTIEFYLAGTTTPTNLYSDNAGTSVGTSITLNSAGMPAVGGNVITLFRDDTIALKLVLKDSSGTTISTSDNIPALQAANIEAIDGLTCDGSTDDQSVIQGAFDSASLSKLIFPEKKTCAIESALTIPANLEIDFNGSTIRKTVTDATDGFQISVGTNTIVRNMTLEIPTGITILRGISLTDGSQAYNVKVTSTDQQNNVGSSERAAFRVDGDDTIVDYLEVENFDRAVRFQNSNDGWWCNIRVTSYTTGVTIPQSQRFTLCNYMAKTQSPNGTAASGQDSLVCEDCIDGQFNNLTLQDASEHGAYISASALDLVFNNVSISDPGKTCFKLSGGTVSGRMKQVQLNGLHCVDPSTGTSAGTNEEALLIEYADYVTVSGFSLTRDNDADGAFRCVYILDSTNVTLNGPVCRDVKSDALVVTDKNVTSGTAATSTLRNIAFNSPKIFTTEGSCFNLDIGDASSVVSGIDVNDMFCGTPSSYGAEIDATGNNITGAVRVSGRVRNAGTGVYTNVQATSDVELRIELQNSESREVLDGVYGTDAACDTDGSTATVTGCADTSDFQVGAEVSVSAGFASGTQTILSKTATTLTFGNPSNAAQSNITVTETAHSASVHSPQTVLNSAAAAVAAILPNVPSGVAAGGCKTFTMNDASNASTLSIAAHETSSPEVGTFNATTDMLVLCWTGSLWYTAKNIGVAF